MIVLDTNVLCETLKPTPDPRVLEWLSSKPRPSLFVTTVTRGEILCGVRLLPDGQRRRQLWAAAQAVFDDDFAGQVLTFDAAAADLFAEIAAQRRGIGRPISQLDAMLAAMTRSHGATLATRNKSDFEHCGIDVINPWD